MVTATRAGTGRASPGAGTAAGLPAPATFTKSGKRVYSPQPAKVTTHRRNARQAASQQRAGASQQAARRREIAAAPQQPAAAPAAASPAPQRAPAAAAASPTTGGVQGAYQQRVAGPVRQAYQARTVGQEGAGALLALFLYPLFVATLTGGPAKARGWLAAKFTNQPYSGPGSKLAPKPVPRIGVVGPGGPGHKVGRP